MLNEDELNENKISRKNTLYGIGIVLGVVILAVVLIIKFRVGPEDDSGDNSKYGFETDTQGWQRHTWVDLQAVTAVAQHTGDAKYGSASLQCTINLIGGDASKGKGGVYVDVIGHPPPGSTWPVDVPMDFLNKTVSMWLYFPADAIGDPSKPNGIKVFFKDASFKNKYSSRRDIGGDIPTDQWVQITVDTATESWSWDDGCNLMRVGELGVEISAGWGSTETFSGTFLIDGVNW